MIVTREELICLPAQFVMRLKVTRVHHFMGLMECEDDRHLMGEFGIGSSIAEIEHNYEELFGEGMDLSEGWE